MRPPNATEREKKIWVAASSHTCGFFRISHWNVQNISDQGLCLEFMMQAVLAKVAHIRSEEVHQSISGSRQGDGTDQENGQHQVGEGGSHIHSLRRRWLHIIQWLILNMFSSRCTDLPHGFDAFDEADVDHTPGAGQTDDHPPLQGAAGFDIRCDIQGLTVPEVIHWSALLTLNIVAYKYSGST